MLTFFPGPPDKVKPMPIVFISQLEGDHEKLAGVCQLLVLSVTDHQQAVNPAPSIQNKFSLCSLHSSTGIEWVSCCYMRPS